MSSDAEINPDVMPPKSTTIAGIPGVTDAGM